MTRVDELQIKYPSIPRDYIIKAEVQAQCIREDGDLNKASRWVGAFTLGSYHNRGLEGTLKEMAEKSPSMTKDGLILRPPREMRFKSGVDVDIRHRSTSPYSVREASEGQFALYENDEKVDNVYFVHPKPREGAEPVTSKGTPISVLLEDRGICFYMNASRYCQYFSTGDQCRFCNHNVAQQDARAAGLDVPVTVNPEEAIEAYKLRNAEVRMIEGFLTMGGMAKPGQALKHMFKFVEGIANAAQNKPNLKTNAHLATRAEMQRMKEVGLDCYGIQFEAMHPEYFPVVCPGKAKHAPYERWVEALHDAVDIFGVGNVSCTPMVPAVTTFIPNGHKTWQEARDYHIEVNNYLIKNGIFPLFIPIWRSEGSVFQTQDPLYYEKFPPTEYYLEVALAHHEAMMEYGLYSKMNKFMICGLHCHVPYAGEIGMLTLAGDVGKWMSDVVPDERNWVAKFIKSVNSPDKTQL